MSKGRLFCGGSALAVTLAMTLGLAPSYAFAQPPAEAAQDDPTLVDEIISTGTFIRGAAEDAAIPVEVIGRNELNERGSPNIEEIARSLTEVGNVQSQSAGGFNAQGYGVSSINLRNLGSGRTLVTFNGRRLADEPTSNGGNVNATGGAMQNINAIPMAALQQVEILKGSGGATYGADAVAGVVNFITRRDLNGVEATGSYTYIDGAEGGAYSANLLWGRRNDLGNILVSFEYDHKPQLNAKERDWATRSPYHIQSVALAPSFAAYQFLIRDGANVEQLIRVGGPGNALYQGAADPNDFPQIGRPVTNVTLLNNAFLRDYGCADVGANLTWSATPTVACQAFSWQIGDLADQTDRYTVFSDFNFDITDTLRYHGEASFSKNNVKVRNIIPGTLATAGVNEPCDPLPESAPGATRACTTFVSYAAQAIQAYSVPGFNPAVNNYITNWFNTPEQAGQAAVQVLTPLQRAGILGASQVYGNGGIVGQGYVPLAPNGTTMLGRVALPTSGWQPFLAETNGAINRPGLLSQNIAFRTTQELKGDLGELWGNVIDFSAAATYSRNITIRQGRTILTDRLQRALNGFATNLDDADGDTCAADETSGSRTIGGATVANVPYTVGAGGGAGDANDTRFDAGAAAGNGCYFLNPFLTAVGVSRINGQANPGFMGGASVGGAQADAQGYAPGYGLANAPGIVRWLYGAQERRSESDNLYLDLVFNGSFTKWELPGGPIGWAAGAQYRYVTRTATINGSADDRINPCSFFTREDGFYQSTENIINTSSTCTGTDSPFTGFPGGQTVQGIGTRETINNALFAEFSLPVLENVGAQFAIRREEARIPFAEEPISATVMNGSIKWQVTPLFALRGSVSETFDTPTVESPSITTVDLPDTGNFYSAALPDDTVNNYTLRQTRTNLFLQPETGTNYDVGIIVQTPDRQISANVAYFNNVIQGQPVNITVETIGRALLGLGRVGQALTNATIDCSDPDVARLFEPGATGQIFGPDVAVVGYIDAAGNRDYSGCRAGTTLEGFDNGGANLPGFEFKDAGDDGLVFALPDRVNAAATKVAGIEADVTWRVPQTLYGGNLVVSTDVTWNLFRKADDVSVFGALVTNATDDTGTLSGGYNAQVNIWRAGLGFTYLRDRHTFSMRTTYVGAVADLAAGITTANLVPAANTHNLNPMNPGLCNFQSQVRVPAGSLPQLEPFYSRENGEFDRDCNLSNGYGAKLSPSVEIGATWRYEMPRETTLTLSIQNILDADPPFHWTQYGYQPFGSVDAYGRTIKLSIEKKWPRAD